MKKWLFPIAYAIISIVIFLLIGVLGVCGNGDGTGYGGVVIILCGIIFYCLIIVPAMCLVYSKRCLSGERFRVLFTFYQSLLISLPYLILSCLSRITKLFFIVSSSLYGASYGLCSDLLNLSVKSKTRMINKYQIIE